MNLDVYRLIETDRSIIGRFTVDGDQFSFDLEPARLHPVHPGHPCIPIGRFRVKLSLSPRLGYITPEILDVPGRSNIRIHKGNKPEDTEGCTVLGATHGPAADWVGDSHDPFDRLVALLTAAEARGEETWIEYHDVAQNGEAA